MMSFFAELADAVPEWDEPPLCARCGKHYVGAPCPGKKAPIRVSKSGPGDTPWAVYVKPPALWAFERKLPAPYGHSFWRTWDDAMRFARGVINLGLVRAPG